MYFLAKPMESSTYFDHQYFEIPVSNPATDSNVDFLYSI